MTLEEMGVLLRQERENRGISLEKAAADIKISKKYLIALEAGQTDELPHPVYAKGFVKNYARLLGLDPEEMGAVLSRHYAVDDDQLKEMPRYEGRESGPAIKERRAPLVKPGGGGGSGASILLGLGGLVVVGGLVWLLFFSGYVNLDVQQAVTFVKSKLGSSATVEPAQQSKTETKHEPKPEAKADKPAPQAVKPEPKAEPAPQAQAEPVQPVQRDLLATGTTAPPEPAPKPEPAITPEKLANEAQFAASGKQVVEVNANQPATVEVSTEDGRNRSFTLVKGQRMSLRFNDRIVVRFLQAPSVNVRLNGKEYPLEGGRADGKSITFP